MPKNLFAEIEQIPRRLGTIESLTARLVTRLVIIAVSLIINSWAIASMAPTLPIKQSATAHQALPTNTLSMNFVTLKRIANTKTKTKTKTSSPETQQSKPKKAQTKTVSKLPRREKKPENKPTQLGLKSAKNSLKDQHTDQPVAANMNEPALTETSPEHQTKPEPKPQSNPEFEISAVEPLTIPVQTEPSFMEPPKPPRYPSLARKRGQQGTVLIELWLDESGHQTKLLVSQSSGVSALDNAAVAAVAKWRFQAHRLNGLNVASRVTVPLEFVLN